MGVISRTIALPIDVLRYVIQAVIRILRLDRLMRSQPAAINAETLSAGMDTNPQDATMDGVRPSERLVKDPHVGQVTHRVFDDTDTALPMRETLTRKQETQHREKPEAAKWEVVMADELMAPRASPTAKTTEETNDHQQDTETHAAPETTHQSRQQQHVEPLSEPEPTQAPEPEPASPSDKLGNYARPTTGFTQMELTTTDLSSANKATTTMHGESLFEPSPVQHVTLLSPSANAFKQALMCTHAGSPTSLLCTSVLKPVPVGDGERDGHQVPVDEDTSHTTDELDRVSIESVISDDTQDMISVGPLDRDPSLVTQSTGSQSEADESFEPMQMTEEVEKANEETADRVLNALLRARDPTTLVIQPGDTADDSSSDDELTDAELEVLHALPPFLDSLVCMSAMYQVI
ncbi:hypothetical protein PINS_up010866 [Pythium insidiosum]|nr:hypothetical protein PINS_up010866 [Pythium insidiosum]